MKCRRALGEFQNAGQQPVQTEAGRYGVTRNTDTTERGQWSSREDRRRRQWWMWSC
jgi:hypothetical protein